MATEHGESKPKLPATPDEQNPGEWEIDEIGLDEATGGQGINIGCRSGCSPTSDSLKEPTK
jgi:hypothetical protein